MIMRRPNSCLIFLLERYLVKCNDTNGNPYLTFLSQGRKKRELKCFRDSLSRRRVKIRSDWKLIAKCLESISICFLFGLPLHLTWLSYACLNMKTLKPVSDVKRFLEIDKSIKAFRSAKSVYNQKVFDLIGI